MIPGSIRIDPTIARTNGVMCARLSSSTRTSRWPAGSVYRRRGVLGAVGLEDAGHGLLLEPFAHIPLIEFLRSASSADVAGPPSASARNSPSRSPRYTAARSNVAFAD
jgi:hypothetical protein